MKYYSRHTVLPSFVYTLYNVVVWQSPVKHQQRHVNHCALLYALYHVSNSSHSLTLLCTTTSETRDVSWPFTLTPTTHRAASMRSALLRHVHMQQSQLYIPLMQAARCSLRFRLVCGSDLDLQ